MSNLFETICQLTSNFVVGSDKTRLLNDFAYHFGWTPSDSVDVRSTHDYATAHLVVEHGLENSAVLTFLHRRYSDLTFEQKRRLLNISYNNLVDWHIQIESDQIIFVFNGNSPERIVARREIARDNVDQLRSEAFEEVSGKRQSRNLPALDDALIETISYWKRFLSVEIPSDPSNRHLSELFNAIVLVRAVEDHFRRVSTRSGIEDFPEQLLLDRLEATGTLSRSILDTFAKFGQRQIPQYLADFESLKVFDQLDKQTLVSLFSDFYRIRGAKPYEYDFSIMSKHALSRIYERYTNLLRSEPEGAQQTLFVPLPEEQSNKALGNIYTPEFVARFFARYLREQMPPNQFRRLGAVEPAVGSGIFLRTMLELQCDPSQPGLTTEMIQEAFANKIGLDADPNAAQAASLSLALLHFVLTNRLPEELKIRTQEAVKYFHENQDLFGTQPAVITNPPFVSLVSQTADMRELVAEFMADDAGGKIDLYLAFLKIGVELLEPGGYGLFVLPFNFLIGKHASKMRILMHERCWIRCLVDLSAIRVFAGVDTYVILLIFQRKHDAEPEPMATIVKCQALAGKALEDAIAGRIGDNNYYSIFHSNQSSFAAETWIIPRPSEIALRERLKTFPKLDEFLSVKVGVITGRDKVFVIDRKQVPKREGKVYIPLLADREMRPYTTPETSDRVVFYPFIGNRRIEESELREKFPGTWDYLLSKREELESRPPVKRGNLQWWLPERPRTPETLLRPKIVSPHLVVMPRFSLDVEGRYAITRSPLLYPKPLALEESESEIGSELDLLYYFLAVLNSSVCYRFISQYSNRYGNGYAMLEPSTLSQTPVPNPNSIEPSVFRQILLLVEKRLLAEGREALEIETELDRIVTRLYGLDPDADVSNFISNY